MANEKLKSSILEVVENQLNMNQPKCTKKTFLRLVELGYSRRVKRNDWECAYGGNILYNGKFGSL